MLGKLTGLVKELGAVNAAAYLLDRLLGLFGPRFKVIKYYFLAQPVPPAGEAGLELHSSLTVRQIGRGEHCLAAMSLNEETLAFRFGQDAVCLGVFDQGELAGCLWFCENGYLEDEVRCRYVPLPAGETVWDFGVYIEPRHRMGRAFAKLWDSAFDWLRNRNHKWSLSRISGFNRVSLASQKRLGARMLGSATFLCLGPLQVTFATIRPYIHVSTDASSMPVWRLKAPDR